MITALLVLVSLSIIGNGLALWYLHKSLYLGLVHVHADIKGWFEQSVGHLKEVLEEKAKQTEQHAESIKTALEGAFENTFDLHSNRLAQATDHLKTQANNLKDEAVQNAVARAPRTAPNRSL